MYTTYQYLQEKLVKQHTQSTHLWSLINRIKNHPSTATRDRDLQDSIAVAFILEEHLQHKLSLSSLLSLEYYSIFTPELTALVKFYSLPELFPNQVKIASNSLLQQIRQTHPPTHLPPSTNSFALLFNKDYIDKDMDIDENSPSVPQATSKQGVTWSADVGIAELSGDIFSHMENQKQKAVDAGDLALDSPEYRKPQDHVASTEKLNQRIRFNLIHHRGAHSDTKVIDLFKSFTITLKKANPSSIIHPFQASQQHFSSLATIKQIQIMEHQKLQQFFKSYHQKQTYSLSGFALVRWKKW
jgi:hypothetical protein